MQAEEFLKSGRKITEELELLAADAEMLKKLTQTSDAVGAKEAATKLRRQAKAVNAKIEEYLALRRRIQAAIDVIDRDECKMLLTRRYLLGEKWETIAEEMHFSRAHIFRLRKQALALVDRLL